MNLPPPALRLRNFGVAFGERVVLDGVNFDVPARGCTALLGPSGTGKSTLLRTLAGYNQANPSLRTWGEVWYRDTPMVAQKQPLLVMQKSRLLVSNVLENLVCDLPDRASLTQRAQIEQVAATLDTYGFAHLLDHLFQKVVERSVGDQRAIAILRLAMARPGVLMIDEPTTGLDPLPAAALLDLIRRIAAHSSVVVVLHHLQQTRMMADQVVLLANGTVQECQPGPEFFAQPASECGRAFLATGSCPELTHADESVTDESPESAAETPTLQPRMATAPARAPAVSAACGPRGFLWLLPGQLAGTPWPGIVHGAAYDLDALRRVGVTRLVSLTETPFDAALAAPYGIACNASPMPDMHPPSIEQALALCSAIDADLARGETVAVHCHAGLGRTGTVLAAYWLWRGGGALSALRALEDVRRIEPGWVQSAAQVKFLEEFALVVANRWAVTAAIHDPVAVHRDTATVI